MSRTAAPAGEVTRAMRPRHPGQGLLVLLSKESLAQQSFFQLFKGYKQVPRTLWGEADAVHLVLPVLRKDGHPPGGDDLHPVLRPETQGGSIPRNITHRRAPSPVFQSKVVVTGGDTSYNWTAPPAPTGRTEAGPGP